MKANKHHKQVGEVTDRGVLKWQGMMLTEHVKMLRDWENKENYMPQPKLDEYDMQLIHDEMDIAMKRQCYVIIHTWSDGKVTRHHGIIIDVNLATRILTYEDPFKSRTLIVDEIVSVNIAD